MQLLQFGRKKRQIINGEPLPLSLKSHLSWLGFTAEGQFAKTDLMFKKKTQLLSFWIPQAACPSGSPRNPVLCGFRRRGPDAEPFPG